MYQSTNTCGIALGSSGTRTHLLCVRVYMLRLAQGEVGQWRVFEHVNPHDGHNTAKLDGRWWPVASMDSVDMIAWDMQE